MHPTDRSRTGNVLTWRLGPDTEVVASNGSRLHERMAGPSPDEAPNRSGWLRDDGKLLDYDTPERQIAPGVRLARSSTGGLSMRVGNLREVLAAAETDALTKLKPTD